MRRAAQWRAAQWRAARWLAGFVIVVAAWNHDGRTAAPCRIVHRELGWTSDESWTEGAKFEARNGVGIWSNADGFIGAAIEGDSIVWSSERCALFNPLYSDSPETP